VIGQLAANYPSTDWNDMPVGLMNVGSGGINGHGVVCGNVLGAQWVLKLLNAPANVTQHQLRWFENTYLPTNAAAVDYRSGTWSAPSGFTWGELPLGGASIPSTLYPIPANNAPKVKPGNVGCHAAHTKWKVAAQSWLAAKGSNYNRDRCGKTSYDAAYKLCTLINAWKAGQTIDGTLDPSVTGCKVSGCHGGTNPYPVTGVSGNMKCEPCHTQRIGDGHNL
jgi:hypothetical protein